MKKILTTVFVSLMVLSATAQRHKLWYDQPAGTWLRALPIGNSQLGAMVYGGTDVEELALNEETFWSGSPHDNNSPEAREHLQEVRDLTLMGREEEAHQLLDRSPECDGEQRYDLYKPRYCSGAAGRSGGDHADNIHDRRMN